MVAELQAVTTFSMHCCTFTFLWFSEKVDLDKS